MPVSAFLTSLLAKVAGGLAAKAAVGLGIATAAVSTAGAAGVLPDPAQHALAKVVNPVSPVDIPDPTELPKIDGTTLADPASLLDGENDELGDVVDDVTGEDEGTERGMNHGACVSAVAQDKSTAGREHGLAVSTAARSDCGKEDAATRGTSTTSSSTTTTTSTPPVTLSSVDESDDADRGKGRSGDDDGPGRSANRGQGSNSSNSGRGNSGK